jgi:hypothetical protein
VEQMTAAICVHLQPFSDILLRPDLLRLGWNIMFLMLAWAMDVEDALISCHHSSSTCIGWLYNLILLGTLCDGPESRLLVCKCKRLGGLPWSAFHCRPHVPLVDAVSAVFVVFIM